MPYHHLALKGGGARGYIYVGAFQELFKLGLLEDITGVSGSSVGAISALFVSAGFSMEKLKDKIFGTDFEKLIFDQWTISEPINWLEYFGLHQGKALYELFQSLVETATGDKNTTFKQWHEYSLLHPEHHLKNIYVEACNISLMGGYNQIFSHDSKLCDTPVALAISASMAFPQYFSPKLINGCYYSDGGMQANCPVGVFEHPKGTPNPDTLGIWLDDHENIALFNNGILPPIKPINNVFDCMSAQIDAVLNTQNFELLESRYKKQMIYCDTLGIGTLDFSLTLAQKKALAASGEYGVIRFVAQHNPVLAIQHYPAYLIHAIQALGYPVSLQGFLKNLSLNSALSLGVTIGNLSHQDQADHITQWKNLDFFKPFCIPHADITTQQGYPIHNPTSKPYIPQFQQNNMPSINESALSTSLESDIKKTCAIQ